MAILRLGRSAADYSPISTVHADTRQANTPNGQTGRLCCQVLKQSAPNNPAIADALRQQSEENK